MFRPIRFSETEAWPKGCIMNILRFTSLEFFTTFYLDNLLGYTAKMFDFNYVQTL